jgi:hypothetical protein
MIHACSTSWNGFLKCHRHKDSLQEKVKQLLAVDMQQAPIKPQCKLRSLCWCNLVLQPWDFKGVDQNKIQQKCEFDPSSVQSMV